MPQSSQGFFNQDYEIKQILKDTGRADRYEAVTRLTLMLFAVGAVLALLIGNVYLVPILGIGFSLLPMCLPSCIENNIRKIPWAYFKERKESGTQQRKTNKIACPCGISAVRRPAIKNT